MRNDLVSTGSTFATVMSVCAWVLLIMGILYGISFHVPAMIFLLVGAVVVHSVGQTGRALCHAVAECLKRD